jgi:hypothetical protein
VTYQIEPENDEALRPPPRPRWVIWLVVGIVATVLVFLGLHLLMGGDRGPMDHRGPHGAMNMGMPVSALVIAGDPM